MEELKCVDSIKCACTYLMVRCVFDLWLIWLNDSRPASLQRWLRTSTPSSPLLLSSLTSISSATSLFWYRRSVLHAATAISPLVHLEIWWVFLLIEFVSQSWEVESDRVRQKLLSLIGRIGREARSEATTGKVRPSNWGVRVHAPARLEHNVYLVATVNNEVSQFALKLAIGACKVQLYVCVWRCWKFCGSWPTSPPCPPVWFSRRLRSTWGSWATLTLSRRPSSGVTSSSALRTLRRCDTHTQTQTSKKKIFVYLFENQK